MYGTGNGAAKELMTHGHGQRDEDCLREGGGAGWREKSGQM